MILGWYQNLPEAEMPPKWMWLHAEELNEHFKEVRANRYSGTSDHDDDEPIEGPVVQNELARRRGRNAG